MMRLCGYPHSHNFPLPVSAMGQKSGKCVPPSTAPLQPGGFPAFSGLNPGGEAMIFDLEESRHEHGGLPRKLFADSGLRWR